MKLGELRELINSISEEFDDITLTKGNPNIGAPEVEVLLDVCDYLGHPYVNIQLDLPRSYQWNGGAGVVTDPYVIASAISLDKKILAIKELRAQTGWGLKESKQYIDRYIPMEIVKANFNFNEAGARFIADHTQDFIEDKEMEI